MKNQKKFIILLAVVVVIVLVVMVQRGIQKVKQEEKKTGADYIEVMHNSQAENVDEQVAEIEKNLSAYTKTTRDESVPDRGMQITTYRNGDKEKLLVEIQGDLQNAKWSFYSVGGNLLLAEEVVTANLKGDSSGGVNVYYFSGESLIKWKQDGKWLPEDYAKFTQASESLRKKVEYYRGGK